MPELKNVTLLYVEDDQSLRENYKEFFQRRVKTVLIASNGQEGLEIFKMSSPDFIVTDIKMPIMNGLEMIQEIKKISHDIPIIITSAYSDQETLMEAVNLGINRYALKPIQRASFKKLIYETIELIELRKQKTDYITGMKQLETIKKQELELRENYKQLNTYTDKINSQYKELKEQKEELKISSVKYQSLFENSPLPYLVISNDSQVIESNKMAQETFFTDLDKDIFFSSFIHKKDHQTFFASLDSSKNETIDEIVIAVKIRNNTYDTFKVITFYNSLIDNYVVSLINIENELLLQQKTKLAALSEMMDAIAHQWKQPLGVISSYMVSLELKRDLGDPLDSFLDELVKSTQSQITHLTSTMSDFRAFFRHDTPKANVQIKKSIDSVLHLLSNTLHQHKVQVSSCNGDNITHRLIETEFQHIIINLINNSIDAFDEKDIKNKQIIFDIAQDEQNVYVYFQDNAGGIDQSIIETIFEPNVSTKKKKGGTGVGLYLSKQIAHKLHGHISVENIQDGCKFTIQLPKNKD